MQESRKEWAPLCPRTSDERKRSAEIRWDDLLSGATVGLGEHAGFLRPLPVSTTGNAEDLKSCETSSSVSQLNGLTGLLQEGPPSAIHRSVTDGPEEKGWLWLG